MIGIQVTGFDVNKDLERLGVVNQTTMLASDTQAIADYLKQVMINKYSLEEANTGERFADTRDTLCYATNDNQTSVSAMLNTDADLAIVVGGYNSSNTSHLVELCEEKLPTYFINNADKIINKNTILHYNFHTKEQVTTTHFLPDSYPVKILLTSGASCPDTLVEEVIQRVINYFDVNKSIAEIMVGFT